MELCEKFGISRSHFLGGPPEWTDEDRALAMAWADYQRDKCGGCGKSLSETTEAEHQHAYAGEVIRCHSCAAQARTVNQFVEDGGDKSGIMFRMTRSPGK